MTRPVRKKPDRGRRKKKPQPPISRRRNPRGRSICMRANARLITAPGRAETPERFRYRVTTATIELSASRTRARPSRLVAPAVLAGRGLPLSLGVIGPHPHLLPRHERAAVASRLGAKPRQLNPE